MQRIFAHPLSRLFPCTVWWVFLRVTIAWRKQGSKADICYYRQTSILNGVSLSKKHLDTASNTKTAANELIPLLSDVLGRQNPRPTRPIMASDEDMHDPDLKAAIAASLQSPEGSGDANDSAPSESPKGLVDLTAD